MNKQIAEKETIHWNIYMYRFGNHIIIQERRRKGKTHAFRIYIYKPTDTHLNICDCINTISQLESLFIFTESLYFRLSTETKIIQFSFNSSFIDYYISFRFFFFCFYFFVIFLKIHAVTLYLDNTVMNGIRSIDKK